MPRPVELPRDDPLVQDLVQYRREAARRLGAPPWRVLPNATLLLIAETKPIDRATLGAVAGMGPTRLQRHARAILTILAKHSIRSMR